MFVLTSRGGAAILSDLETRGRLPLLVELALRQKDEVTRSEAEPNWVASVYYPISGQAEGSKKDTRVTLVGRETTDER